MFLIIAISHQQSAVSKRRESEFPPTKSRQELLRMSNTSRRVIHVRCAISFDLPCDAGEPSATEIDIIAVFDLPVSGVSDRLIDCEGRFHLYLFVDPDRARLALLPVNKTLLFNQNNMVLCRNGGHAEMVTDFLVCRRIAAGFDEGFEKIKDFLLSLRESFQSSPFL